MKTYLLRYKQPPANIKDNTTLKFCMVVAHSQVDARDILRKYFCDTHQQIADDFYDDTITSCVAVGVASNSFIEQTALKSVFPNYPLLQYLI